MFFFILSILVYYPWIQINPSVFIILECRFIHPCLLSLNTGLSIIVYYPWIQFYLSLFIILECRFIHPCLLSLNRGLSILVYYPWIQVYPSLFIILEYRFIHPCLLSLNTSWLNQVQVQVFDSHVFTNIPQSFLIIYLDEGVDRMGGG